MKDEYVIHHMLHSLRFCKLSNILKTCFVAHDKCEDILTHIKPHLYCDLFLIKQQIEIIS